MKHSFFICLSLFSSSFVQGTILIIDFGCPAAKYIQYHVQSLQVPCVVCDHTIADDAVRATNPAGVILSGSPFSVYNQGSPQIPQFIFEIGIPIFGICYGQQLLAHQLGGRVENMGYRERGPIQLTVIDTCLLTQDIWRIDDMVTVWMAHEDRVIDVPAGFKTIASTASSPYAILADDLRKYYGVQFHPEVPKNSWPELIEQFVLKVVGESQDFSLDQPMAVSDRVLAEFLSK